MDRHQQPYDPQFASMAEVFLLGQDESTALRVRVVDAAHLAHGIGLSEILSYA
jgi:hypothetical protein